MYCFHRKSLQFLQSKRLQMKVQLNPKERGRWVWWHLFQRWHNICCLRDFSLPGQFLAFIWERVLLCRKRRPLQMSWPPLKRNRAAQLICRMWSRSTSQTSALWLSRRSSNCRVSQRKSPQLETSVNICRSDDWPRSLSASLHPPDSCFLSCNDLTHSLSSYLKQGEFYLWHTLFLNTFSVLIFRSHLVCPKWAKIQKQHSERSSVVLLVVCSSALRTIELIKWVTSPMMLVEFCTLRFPN